MSRFDNFLNKKLKVKSDDMNIPSIIEVDGKDYSLLMSIDRKHLLFSAKKFLIDKVALTEDMSIQVANEYLDRKYKEYMDYVMSM